MGILQRIMADMAEKSEELTGNHYMVIVTQKLWNDIQIGLGSFLVDAKTDGTYMYSRAKNGGEGGYVKVGATFNTYEFGGNKISFVPDKALTRFYGNKGYGLFLDLTHDKAANMPAISKVSLTGKEYTINDITGVQGMDGRSSGPAYTTVAGSKKVMMSVCGAAVWAPYRSFILMEA